MFIIVFTEAKVHRKEREIINLNYTRKVFDSYTSFRHLHMIHQPKVVRRILWNSCRRHVCKFPPPKRNILCKTLKLLLCHISCARHIHSPVRKVVILN